MNFTSSYGDTFEDAVKNIIEASELYCEDLKTLPKAFALDEKNIVLEANAIPQIISVKVEKLKRINVMMRSYILEALPERLVEV